MNKKELEEDYVILTKFWDADTQERYFIVKQRNKKKVEEW